LTFPDLHLSTLNSTFAYSHPFFEVDGHPLIDFQQCSELAEQIDSLVQFSPPRNHRTRQDALAFVEYSLRSSTYNDDSEARGAELAEEEQSMLKHRTRLRAFGIQWPLQRRKWK
jgi:hypothetical protein